jgi:hypothetical protein
VIIESIAWRSLQWPGHETARLIELPGSRIIEGVAAFEQDNQPCGLSYSITCDEHWVTQRTRVTGSVGTRPIDVDLTSLDGLIDIDLNFSPSTNTLPIRRLKLEIGQSAEVTAAWLRFPSFALQPLEQEYTRTGEETYRYRNRASGFTAELRVSAHGLVVDYGDLWTAISRSASG